MSRHTLYICMNGIRTNPGSQRAWTDEFTTQINIRTPDGSKAEKFEYACSALFRFWGQRARCDELIRRINFYANCGYRIVLIGHSNGCDMIARVLGLGIRVDSVHLFAPAAWEEDFEEPILGRIVRRIHIYGSPDDQALLGASITSKLLRCPLLAWAGLGYGSLGLRGPEFAGKYPDTVLDHSMKGYGHSTWFLPGPHMELSIRSVLDNDAGDIQSLNTTP